jgi:hypothetical protein
MKKCIIEIYKLTRPMRDAIVANGSARARAEARRRQAPDELGVAPAGPTVRVGAGTPVSGG